MFTLITSLMSRTIVKKPRQISHGNLPTLDRLYRIFLAAGHERKIHLEKTMKLFFILSLCLTATAPAVAETDGSVSAGTFLSSERPLWQEESFEGHTDYQFIPDGESLVLKAHCEGMASAFYRRMKVDLTKTPILRWSWRVEGIHADLDDISKEGDDYAARVYVVYKGKMPWDVSALNYVWANRQQKGTSWLNAFSGRAMMVAQESGVPEDSGVWIEESRNVRQDFKNHFGMDVAKIDGVAVMTDCDNGGGAATGYYRDIRFTAEE